MANANPTYIGADKGISTSDAHKNALFLKVFSGEVMATYNANTVLKDRVRTRKISAGKSAQFPAIGKIAAEYHTPGSELLGKAVHHGETTISIDNMLVSHVFVSNYEEAKSHYEVRSEYSKQIGQALAQTFDRQLFEKATKGVLADGSLQEGAIAEIPTAGRGNQASITTAKIIEHIYTAAATFDANNVPEDGRFVVVPPTVFYAMLQDDSAAKLIDKDYSAGNADLARATMMRIANFEVVKSNNVAVNHQTTGTKTPATEGVNATKLKALCMHRDTMGVVQLMDMSSEAEYDIRRQGTLMVSKMAIGTGILRPDSLYGIFEGT